MNQVGDTHTAEISSPAPKTFFRSKWWSETVVNKGKGKVVTTNAHHSTYERPKLEGEIKGKLNLKAAKRARVRAWKAEKAMAAV